MSYCEACVTTSSLAPLQSRAGLAPVRRTRHERAAHRHPRAPGQACLCPDPSGPHPEVGHEEKTLSVGAALLAVAASVLLFVKPAYAAVGLHIEGRNIVEANGQTFVMRGVNHPHVWFTGQTSSFANIKALGANTVRVVLGSGKRWGPSTDVADVIALCKQNRLICVLEVHDTTGYGEDGAAATLDEAVNYWISQKSALVGQENYVVINIGNEPIGNTNAGQWTAATTAAIQKMRSQRLRAPAHGRRAELGPGLAVRHAGQRADHAGRRHPAATPCCRSTCTRVFNTAAAITDYLNRFQTNGWPLVIGEFGWQVQRQRGRPRDDAGRGAGPRPGLPRLVLERQHRPDPGHGDRTSTPPSSPPGASGSSTAPTASGPPPGRPRSSRSGPRPTDDR